MTVMTEVSAPGETTAERPAVGLTVADRDWLASFGVDPSWSSDDAVTAELNEIIAIGSLHIDEDSNDGDYQQIVLARERFFEFVGIEPKTVEAFQNTNPTLIPLDTFISTQRVISELGLDAGKIINTLPAAISYAPESVRAKVDNFTDLGLDAIKIINTLPAAISYAPESVRAKVNFLRRSANLLQWSYRTEDLIETYPPILSFSTDKLRILRRIAATELTDSMRDVVPRKLKGNLITPLEKYIISIPDTSTEDPDELLKRARNLKLSPQERKDRAGNRAKTGELGRVGTMYLRYAK